MASSWWPTCLTCSGTGEDFRKPCRACGGGGRVQPPQWDGELAAACARAERELHGGSCQSCGGVGSIKVGGYGAWGPCPTCNGAGRVVTPRRPPAHAPWLTMAEVAGELGITVPDVATLIRNRKLVPVVSATVGATPGGRGQSVPIFAHVFDAAAIAAGAER
jgi:hypothetical protein